MTITIPYRLLHLYTLVHVDSDRRRIPHCHCSTVLTYSEILEDEPDIKRLELELGVDQNNQCHEGEKNLEGLESDRERAERLEKQGGIGGAQRDGGNQEGWREQREMERAERFEAGTL